MCFIIMWLLLKNNNVLMCFSCQCKLSYVGVQCFRLVKHKEMKGYPNRYTEIVVNENTGLEADID